MQEGCGTSTAQPGSAELPASTFTKEGEEGNPNQR